MHFFSIFPGLLPNHGCLSSHSKDILDYQPNARPPLLSPDLPRFPGFCDGEDGNPEPDWSPPPSPLSCEDVHDMAPDGAFLTLEGFRAHSQLAHVAFQAARVRVRVWE